MLRYKNIIVEYITFAAVKSAPKIWRQSMTTGSCEYPSLTPILQTFVLRKSTAGKYKLFPGVIIKYSKPEFVYVYNTYIV